jgi:hypothetical protein
MTRIDKEKILMRAVLAAEQPRLFRAPDGIMHVEINERIMPIKSWHARASLDGIYDRIFRYPTLTHAAARKALTELEADADAAKLALPPLPEPALEE